VVPESRLFHGSDLERYATYRGGRVPPHSHTTTSIAILVRGRAAVADGDWTGRRFDMDPGG
jgi:hypothetical protein